MTKLAISERALLARVNRALSKEGHQKVLRCKDKSKWIGELGRFYAVDSDRNTVTAKQIDLASWAKELKVMADWEEMAS